MSAYGLVLRDVAVRLPAAQLRTYVVLCSYANWRGEAFPSRARLAADLGVKRATVRKTLAELVRAGVIEHRKEGKRESWIVVGLADARKRKKGERARSGDQQAARSMPLTQKEAARSMPPRRHDPCRLSGTNCAASDRKYLPKALREQGDTAQPESLTNYLNKLKNKGERPALTYMGENEHREPTNMIFFDPEEEEPGPT